MTTHTITVRFAGLTWRTSRVDGQFATCAEGPEAAARALARKLWGPGEHKAVTLHAGSSHGPATYIIEQATA